MATKRAGLGRNAEQQSRLTMTVDFYKVQDDAGGPAQFSAALLQASRARGSNRSAIVFGERVDLYESHSRGYRFEGELGRVRMNDTPAIANVDCTLNEIDLEDEQGIAERTAFLFDSQTSILSLHTRREAVSASRIAGYCDRIAGNTIESFHLLPVLRPDAAARFRSMNVIRKVEVEYTSRADGAIPNADQTTRGFLRGLRNLDGETLTVTVSSGRTKESRLSFEGASDLVRNAFASREQAVQKLVISGRNAGDERVFIDLLEDRLRVKVPVTFRGRTPSYEQRRNIVRAEYEKNLPLLQ